MKFNIWYLSKYVAPPGYGRAGSRGYLLMQELARLSNNVTVITSDSNHLINPPVLNGKYLLETIDQVTICWLRTLKYRSVASFRRIISWLDFEFRILFIPRKLLTRPDILIVSSLSLFTILNGLRLRFIYKCLLVFEVRDIWPLTLTEEGGFSPYNPLVIVLALTEYIGYKFSDVIVGTMPNLSEHVKLVLGYPKTAYCIPMGIDNESDTALGSIDDDYLQTYFPRDKFIVAHVGSMGTTNALATFFECADSLCSNNNILFLAVGRGDLRDFYVDRYRHLPNLSFPPCVPKHLVQQVLSHCDILYFSVFNSKVWQFGQSLNKLIDYMLAGKPIVASYSGYPSMVNEAGCGSFVPSGCVESLKLELLRYYQLSEHQRFVIGNRGKEWLLQNRSYKKLALDYLNILSASINQ